MGRTIGAKGVGIFNLSYKIVVVLIILCTLGFPQFLIKEGAKATINSIDKSFISSLKYTSYRLVAITCCFVFLFIILFLKPISFNIFQEPELKWPLAVMLIGMIPQLFTRLLSSLIFSFRKVWQGNLFNEKALNIYIVGLLFFVSYVLDVKLEVLDVAIIFALSYTLVYIVAEIYWRNIFGGGVKKIIAIGGTLKKTLPFYSFYLINIVISNLDILILGMLVGTESLGIYSIAVQLAFLTSFVLQVTNSAISPKLAILYADGKLVEMETMVRRVTSLLIIIGGLFSLYFVFFGRFTLSLWGEDFTEGYVALLILCVGQFISIITGCTGQILAMCGYEKVLVKISSTSLILSIMLYVVLISSYGFLGAAIVNALRLIYENGLKLYFVNRKIKINTLPRVI